MTYEEIIAKLNLKYNLFTTFQEQYPNATYFSFDQDNDGDVEDAASDIYWLAGRVAGNPKGTFMTVILRSAYELAKEEGILQEHVDEDLEVLLVDTSYVFPYDPHANKGVDGSLEDTNDEFDTTVPAGLCLMLIPG